MPAGLRGGEAEIDGVVGRADIERRQAAQRIASLQLQTAETVRQAARQVRSTAERVDAARASATLAQQRFDAEQRRYEVGLSTTFLVTQAQRDFFGSHTYERTDKPGASAVHTEWEELLEKQ